jgi:membrane associated rhomboid family serine protease
VTTTVDAPARSSAPLAVAWFVTALVVGPVGFLLLALSEGSGDRLLGLVLGAAGVLAGVTGAVALASGAARVRRWSLTLSGGMVVLGAVGAVVALTDTPAYVEDALLLGLPPAVGGLVTGLLALRR